MGCPSLSKRARGSTHICIHPNHLRNQTHPPACPSTPFTFRFFVYLSCPKPAQGLVGSYLLLAGSSGCLVRLLGGLALSVCFPWRGCGGCSLLPRLGAVWLFLVRLSLGFGFELKWASVSILAQAISWRYCTSRVWKVCCSRKGRKKSFATRHCAQTAPN